MSVDLAFWKYKKGEYLDNDEVYRRGSDGLLTEGLEQLPADDILSAFSAEFEGWERTDNSGVYIFDGGDRGMFELLLSAQFVRTDCRGMDYGDLNRIIDVMHSFGCPLYDPALPQRFDTDINI